MPDAGQTGVVRQCLVQGVAQVLPVGQVETGRFDEMAFGADPLEEHHQLQLEEDHRINRGAAPVGITDLNQGADEPKSNLASRCR